VSRIVERADELRAARVPFVHARVVWAAHPTAAHPGDEALVLGDGTMEGFVGGDCAEATVRAQALAVLDSGEPVVLRISPTTEEPIPGKVMAHNPCLSGGALEIFLAPQRPAPLVVVVGASPIASALVDIGTAVGYELVAGSDVTAGASAVVVASHGRDEAGPLTAALRAGVEYVGLVASPKRGAAVIAALDIDEPAKARVVTPAGLDIGARTAREVAVSILADIIARRARPSARPPTPDDGGSTMTATDVVCGMTVAATDASLHLDRDGVRRYFCGSGCLRAFAADPSRYT
jgi:xanthine dehydrogenase accessory factor